MIKIREVVLSDRPHLQALFLKVRQATFSWMDIAAFDVLDFDEETEGEHILVAICDNQLVGFISIWMEDLFIHHLYVDTAYQNKGIGKALLMAFLGKEKKVVQLKCLEKNEHAITFYKRNNFIEKERGTSVTGDYILFETVP